MPSSSHTHTCKFHCYFWHIGSQHWFTPALANTVGDASSDGGHMWWMCKHAHICKHTYSVSHTHLLAAEALRKSATTLTAPWRQGDVRKGMGREEQEDPLEAFSVSESTAAPRRAWHLLSTPILSVWQFGVLAPCLFFFTSSKVTQSSLIFFPTPVPTRAE